MAIEKTTIRDVIPSNVLTTLNNFLKENGEKLVDAFGVDSISCNIALDITKTKGGQKLPDLHQIFGGDIEPGYTLGFHNYDANSNPLIFKLDSGFLHVVDLYKGKNFMGSYLIYPDGSHSEKIPFRIRTMTFENGVLLINGHSYMGVNNKKYYYPRTHSNKVGKK